MRKVTIIERGDEIWFVRGTNKGFEPTKGQAICEFSATCENMTILVDGKKIKVGRCYPTAEEAYKEAILKNNEHLKRITRFSNSLHETMREQKKFLNELNEL